MRPYLAIVKDSFREALSSRVLPFLLVFFTLVLLIIAPIGLEESVSWRLTRRDVRDAEVLFKHLQADGQLAAQSPGKRFWNGLPDDVRTLNWSAEENPRQRIRATRQLVEGLNDALQKQDLYDETLWRGSELPEAARELLDEGVGSLDEDHLGRLNRLLLEAAYPDDIVPTPAVSVTLTWFGYESFLSGFIENISVERERVAEVVASFLALATNWIVGKFGVLIAIVITAGIIPKMFEPGAIDLLLSKPVSRSFLFLTKFFSGCAFILISAGYFMLGVWLIVGVRLGVWNAKILLAVPVLLFVFAIVYSISAVAGVIWRNTIVCVLITTMLWGFCWLLGNGKAFFDLYRNQNRAEAILPVGTGLIVTNKHGEAFRWKHKGSQWEEVFKRPADGQPTFGFSYPYVGPVYDPQGEQIIALNRGQPQFGRTQNMNRLIVGRRGDDWSREVGLEAPTLTKSLFVDPKGRIIAAGPTGMHRLDGDPATGHRAWGFWGIDFARRDDAARFEHVGPEPKLVWKTPFTAAMRTEDSALAVVDAGRLSVLTPDNDERYQVQAQVDTGIEQSALVGIGGSTIVVATGDGEIRVFNAAGLEQKTSVRPFDDNEPRAVHVSADGRWFAVLFHHRRLWMYDARKDKPVVPPIRGSGDVAAVAFDADQHLLVADRLMRITEYTLGSFEQSNQFGENSSTSESIYRYLVNPLYIVLPKPDELGQVIDYLFTERDSEAVTDAEDLRSERQVYDLWTPIWSNLAFMSVMLAIACFYISRKDF